MEAEKVETAVIIATEIMTPIMVTIVRRLFFIMDFSVTRYMMFIAGSPRPAKCGRPQSK